MKSHKRTKNNKKRLGEKNSLRIILLSLVGVAMVLVIAWLLMVNLARFPLGEKFEYVTKYDYGCHFICDSPPSSTYYYVTDLKTNEEIADYFTKAQLKNAQSENFGKSITLRLESKHSAQPTLLIYIEELSNLPEQVKRQLENTNKTIVSIDSNQYELAKDLL